MDLAKQFGDSLGESINTVVAECLKKATEKAEQEVGKLLEQTKHNLYEMEKARPIMHVQINAGEPRKLSTRAAPVLPKLLLHAELGLLTLMVGPAGCGKTTAAKQLSEALGLQFGSLCLTAGASETWLFGRQTPNGFVEGSFSKIYKEGGVFLADEMDAADANLLLSINTALSHGEMFNPMSGETIKKHEKFVFVGAANTSGKGATHLYTGRSRLDAATLDRFVTIFVDYDEQLEKELCDNQKFSDVLHRLRKYMREQGFDEFISTRVFDMSGRKLKAKVFPEDIIKVIHANWGEPAKELAMKTYHAEYQGSKHGIRTPDMFSMTASEVMNRMKNSSILEPQARSIEAMMDQAYIAASPYHGGGPVPHEGYMAPQKYPLPGKKRQ